MAATPEARSRFVLIIQGALPWTDLKRVFLEQGATPWWLPPEKFAAFQ